MDRHGSILQRIKTQLNQSLEPLGIITHVGLDDGCSCLYVSLTSVEVLNEWELV